MEAKKLEIQTLSVQIKVLTVDQKRFTKALFNQLPTIDADLIVDYDIGVFKFPVLGFVRDSLPTFDSRVVLVLKNEVLYRSRIYSWIDNSDCRVKAWHTLTPDKQLFISI